MERSKIALEALAEREVRLPLENPEIFVANRVTAGQPV